MTASPILRLCRPKQWVKNLFVFLPLFFSGNILNLHKLAAGMIAFVSFSLISSAIYCLNDIVDVEADRKHPMKCLRPVASGEISRRGAMWLMSALCLFSVGFALFLPFPECLRIAGVVLLYLILNIAYCFVLKRVALLDVAVISFGFVLRIVAGGVTTDIFISHWIVLMTFLLALFLALSKRREDLIIYQRTGEKMRKDIVRYNLEFVSQSTTLVATVMLVCYIMYTVSPEVVERFKSGRVYVTSLFVLIGLLRYMQLTVVDSSTGSPTRTLLHDRFIQLCLLCWVITFFIIIYL